MNNNFEFSEAQEVNYFLLSLNEIGKSTLNFLYPSNFFQGEFLNHKPLLCSFTKKEDNILIHINNLFYSYGNFTHQLCFSATKESDQWIFDVCCTTWNREQVYPLNIDFFQMNSWIPVVEASMKHRELSLESHPLMQSHIASLPGRLSQDLIEKTIESNSRLSPIFEKNELNAIYGNILGIEEFNCSNLLQSYLEEKIVNGASLKTMKESLKSYVFKSNNQVFAHLFLQASDSNIFEACLNLKIESITDKSGSVTFKSVVIDDGFYVEWMKKNDGEHPCTTKLNAPDRTMFESDSVRSQLNFSDARTD